MTITCRTFNDNGDNNGDDNDTSDGDDDDVDDDNVDDDDNGDDDDDDVWEFLQACRIFKRLWTDLSLRTKPRDISWNCNPLTKITSNPCR